MTVIWNIYLVPALILLNLTLFAVVLNKTAFWLTDMLKMFFAAPFVLLSIFIIVVFIGSTPGEPNLSVIVPFWLVTTPAAHTATLVIGLKDTESGKGWLLLAFFLPIIGSLAALAALTVFARSAVPRKTTSKQWPPKDCRSTNNGPA